MDEDQGPSQIVPGTAPKRTMGDRLRSTKNRFFTKDGLIGDYDYAFLFTPNLPFMRKSRKAAPFFGLNDRMPTLLALLLGFQHALAMLAGIITPPILLSGAAGANLTGEMQQYLVSTALIVSGLLSMIQITRFHILKTPYYIGTGLISVVGISFAIIPVAQGALSQMYANGFCPMDGEGNKLPCPDGYGAIIGSSALCALIEIAISFMPPKVMLRIFPPIVTGPTVMLIGIHLIETGFQNWMGGSGPCANPTSDFFARCPNISAPHALPWGSAEYLGLGFSVFVTIILCERFGAPIMKSTSVVIGLLVGCIIAAATGYFDRSGIDSAPAASFIWVHTFKLTLYGPLILPLLAVYIICATEAIGDITATCDVSRLEVEGRLFESRIQGGVLADGINGVLAALMTITPMTTFAQNNGVIALTRCANRSAGYCCCFFLIIMGIFAKFAASLVAIPSSVLGGMTSFLFTAVAVSGMAIITKGVPFNRRNRFILTAGLTLGYGATLVPTYFDNVFTYAGDNRGLRGFLDAIVLIMETGFAITAFVCMFLNFVLDEEIEDTEGHDVIPTTGIVTPKDVNGGESARGADSEDIQPVGHNTTGKRDEKLS
ncbi:uracil-xanthine permease [Colletotrichum abscissum]|uniref:Uracil-xanthine permease n=5 Tax=Colletotrichum acutatum species complex TaxID=2707335 RepID=A0A135TWG8_9PEZI|nr:uracil-xanthine permease [Colletotrichum costaricense]XP_060395533.1 uracil-xanthine permease [Colletotrichum abscissum]KAK1477722.1 uracil-xanthine permease [Colletotrichum cuscutae]KXH52407.1 uracil-xanthine permease [Colletotrichum nymphaeae SA-01]KXH52481.1 uracil-xanthine permease [Colletotrichum simmondsii]KAK1487917.1 uracil-xanthine permease [Colletotrichum abscissum]KAK1512277.1 uracil-xanthine permease [Colletotrichum costaricense]